MHGIVKGVLSGDTLLIMGPDSSKGPPPEKLLSLAGVQAPRLGNRSGTPDAPFAWESREFLRKLAIGKRVSFRIDAISGANGGAPQGGPPREFGSVEMDGVSLASVILNAGWARLKPTANQTPEQEDLARIAAAAEEARIGVYGQPTEGCVRQVKWAGTFDAAALLSRLKGTPQDAVVEQVPSGSFMRLMLLPGFEQVTIILSGIQAPALRRLEDGTEEAAPFAREARYFVESRLLHRDVQVKLEGLDKNGTLFGTVLHPQGNMSLELVKVGLARVVDWSSTLVDNAPVLRTAERAAKEKRLRIWKDYVPPNVGSDMGDFSAKVVEVFSGDTIIVVEGTSTTERRFSLASVRAPRMGKEPEPYALESKECLRKLIIGKKVKITPEYRKTFTQENGTVVDRVFCSCIYNNDKNAAVSLIGEGLAQVDNRQSDERSKFYEEMLEAQTAATSAKKGIHSGTVPSRTSNTDLTLPTAKDRAKSYLPSLQRHGKMRAVVQYVVNGARFKLTLPKENVLISFVCVGLRCPACARRDGAGAAAEPFGDEALAFTRHHCFQRDVEVEIEALDKTGSFLGSLFLPDKRNHGVLLLEEGLASRIPPAADRSTYADELFHAEEKAKTANSKIWEGYSEEQEAEAKAKAAEAAAAEAEPVPDSQKQMVQLMLTEIIDGARFYAHVATDNAVEMLQQKLAASCIGSAPTYEPRPGAICCARFSQDDEWYRAKVLKKDKSDYSVFFIDYGNSDVCTADRLRPLDPTLGAQAISPQAIDCRLACCTVGAADDNGDGTDAVMSLAGAAWGKPVFARVEDRQAGVLHVTLFDAAQSSVNEQLVASGLARVEKDVAKRNSLLAKSLADKELTAKNGRLGMWRYGDIDADDAPEFGVRPRPVESKPNAWKK